MRSSQVAAGDTGTIGQYNKLRDDAYASSMLLPHEQNTPDLTLKIELAKFYFNGSLIEYAGGNSPSFTAPSGNPRIDVLSINSSGTLVRTAGTEAASPVAPALPARHFPIAQIYNRVGQTTIRDVDTTGQGYILKDLRVFLQVIEDSFGDGSDGAATLDGSTNYATWSSRSGSDYTMTRDAFFTDLTINGSVNLITNGYRIFVNGTLSGSGVIKNNGNNGSNASGTSGGAGGTAHTGYFINTAGATGANGVSGSAVAGNAGTSPTNGLCTNAAGNGGKGGRGDSGAPAAPNGGTGGTATAPIITIGKTRFNTIHGLLWSSAAIAQYRTGGSGGSGGGGGDTDGGNTAGGGGGGGASGGFVFICARVWAGSFNIEAKGGNGGNGANATGSAAGGGGGGGGCGGFALVIRELKTWTGSFVLTGGTGGTQGSPSGGGQNDATAGTSGGTGVSLEVSMYNLI